MQLGRSLETSITRNTIKGRERMTKQTGEPRGAGSRESFSVCGEDFFVVCVGGDV